MDELKQICGKFKPNEINPKNMVEMFCRCVDNKLIMQQGKYNFGNRLDFFLVNDKGYI
jgi:hypothetical protein